MWENHLRERPALILQLKDPIPTLVLEARFDGLQAEYLTGKTRPATLGALDKITADYASLAGPTYPALLAFRADIAALLAQTGDPAGAATRYQALIREAPDSPSRRSWQQALESLP